MPFKKVTNTYGKEVSAMDLDMLSVIDITLEILSLDSEPLNQFFVGSGMLTVLFVLHILFQRI
jgi:hypothetical protein